MKEPQGAMIVGDPHLTPLLPQCDDRNSLSTRGGGNSLLLLQLRTELEGKWRPDKFGILRRWMNVSPKHWFCQKEDVHDYAMRPAMIIKSSRKSATRHARRKQKARYTPSSMSSLSERFDQQSGSKEETVRLVDCRVDSEFASDQDQRKIRRFLLEEEVMVLRKLLQRESELHVALENVVNPSSHTCKDRPRFPTELPASTLELLEDLANLEDEVAELEKKARNLQSQVDNERKEREDIELRTSDSDEMCQPISGSEPNVPPKVSRRKRTSTVTERPIHHCPSTAPAATLGDHLQRASGFRPTQAAHPLVQPFKSGTLETQRKAVLTWKSRACDAEQTPSRITATDCVPDLRCLSKLDHHSRVRCTESLIQEPTHSFAFSPPRFSNSGASTDDQSGSCGTIGERDFCNSGLLTVVSPPTSPEHRLRPTSPVSSADLQFLSNTPREAHFKRTTRFRSPPENTTARSHPSEEFYTPKTSSSSGDRHCADSQPSSTEKPRSKVRVRLNLEAAADETPKALGKIYDADSETARCLMRGILSPRDFETLPASFPSSGDEKRQLKDYSRTPNVLSEEMVKCMISIYCHLADPAVINHNKFTCENIPSPNSHFGHTTLSSFSSTSDSSLLSFVRSPLVDLRSKDDILGCENSPDPYKVRGRLPWADIGTYGKVLQVPWMTVTKEQLGYAAQALHKFRLLVEQLAHVNPGVLSHSEKLAFWLNLYNALMMHAYLAYGIPRNDLKYFALLQKAAYNVGGHTLNAATMEFTLLRGKCPSYRPQIGLLLALHKNKVSLTEEQSKFGIDYPEPQIVFGMCNGARSSPAVRVYTAGQVHKELNIALRDYTRASAGLNPKGKLVVPKLLYTYAHEFVEDSAFLDWVCRLLPSNQAGLITECWQHRQNRLLGARKFSVLSFDFSFRYLFVPIESSNSG